MTIQLRSWYPMVSPAGHYRTDQQPFAPPPGPDRYCRCGTKLRRTNPERLCNPCDDKQRAAMYARQRWFRERGLL